MFKKIKQYKASVDRFLEMYIQIINECSTIRAQHEYLFSRIRDLEVRLERLEPKEEMKINIFAGEGEL
jgi:hypothetical protein